MSKHEYTSENQPDPSLKVRGKAKKTLMLDAIRAQCEGGEQEFLKKVVEHALGFDGAAATEDTPETAPIPPNPQLLTLVLNRIEPPLKATMPLIEFDFDHTAKPHEQAAQVIEAVSNGIMSPDIGSMFISSIKSMLEIEEYTELKARIERLEDVLNGESS